MTPHPHPCPPPRVAVAASRTHARLSFSPFVYHDCFFTFLHISTPTRPVLAPGHEECSLPLQEKQWQAPGQEEWSLQEKQHHQEWSLPLQELQELQELHQQLSVEIPKPADAE